MTSPALSRLLAEIAEQPAVVARLVRERGEAVAQVARLLDPAVPVVFVARGSSDHAAVYGRYLFETRNRLLTALAAPSTVTLYRAGPRLSRAVVIALSQSGRGEDVVAYVQQAREQGAHTVAIVNDPNSPLALSAEYVLDCGAGPEISVPATKTVLAEMTLLALLSHAAEGADARAAFAPVPDALERALHLRPQAARLAELLARQEALSVVGRGLAFPVALELGLKLKEMADARAEPFSAADFLHGPVTLLDDEHGAVLVDVAGPTSAPALEMAALAQRRGARAVLLRAGRLAPQSASRHALEFGADLEDDLAPLVGLVLAQALALEVALAKRLDPATPRGLSKLTSTR